MSEEKKAFAQVKAVVSTQKHKTKIDNLQFITMEQKDKTSKEPATPIVTTTRTRGHEKKENLHEPQAHSCRDN